MGAGDPPAGTRRRECSAQLTNLRLGFALFPTKMTRLCRQRLSSRGWLEVKRTRSTMAKTPKVGEQAPDFELRGTSGPFKLSDHRGERVVLLFYPGDNTMVCTKQFCSYRDRAEDF